MTKEEEKNRPESADAKTEKRPPAEDIGTLRTLAASPAARREKVDPRGRDADISTLRTLPAHPSRPSGHTKEQPEQVEAEDIGTLRTLADPSTQPLPKSHRPDQAEVSTVALKLGAHKTEKLTRPRAGEAERTDPSLNAIYPVSAKQAAAKAASGSAGIDAPDLDPATGPTILPVKAPGGDRLGERLRASGVLPRLDEPLTDEHPGRYEIKSQIGRGGIGRVMLGIDRHLGREVAIKELLPSHLSGESRTDGSGSGYAGSRSPAERRFLDEARITGQLEHPGVVPIYELGQRADGSIYYTMKLVRGRTMGLALKGKKLAGRLEVLPHFLELCHAVAYAHSRGVVHRDLKPENVMLGEFGETVVLDWGLAKIKGRRDGRLESLAEEIEKLRRDTGTETVVGVALGTPSYMPPEQAAGDVDAVDERSDVYSLGAILYEILTGRPPHGGRTAGEVLEKVQKEDVVRPRKREPETPPELEAITLRALSRNPEDRYPSARELADDVRRFQAGRLVRAHTYTFGELVRRWVRRNWKAMVALAGVLALAAGVWWYRGYSERSARRTAELRRKARVAAQVDEIITRTAKGSLVENWLDIYTYKVISLKEPLVEDLLMRALGHEKADVRRLAARSLGGMKAKRAVDALCGRLKDRVEESESVAIEVINALGIIGDSRAEIPVRKARLRYGQYTHVWKSTELAYRMIPLPPLPKSAVTAEMLNERGWAALNKGDSNGALKLYARAIEMDPRLAKSYSNRANVLKGLGRFKQALADYNRAIELDPTATATLNNRALLRRQLGDFKGALEDLDRAVASDKNTAIALFNRAVTHRMLGNLDRALADYGRLLSLQPKKLSAYFSLAVLWRGKKNLDRALSVLDKALKIEPRYLDGLLLRASILILKKDLASAMADLDRILAIDPAHSRALLFRARVRLMRGDRKEARADMDRAVAVHPEEPWTWGGRACFGHYRLKDYKNALSDFERAVTVAEKKGRSQSHAYRLFAASAALRMGDRRKAEQLIAGARVSDPPHPEDLIVLHLRGKVDGDTLIGRRGDPQWKCRANFYVGLRAELDGRLEAARAHYGAALDSLRNWNIEYGLARANLEAISKTATQNRPRGL